jgi:hypothetical protein
LKDIKMTEHERDQDEGATHNQPGYSNDLTQLMQCMATTFGQKTGAAIKTEVARVIGLEQVDTAAITAAVNAIQALLDENGNSADGIQLGQNIIARLTSLSGRLDSLENSTALSQLTVIVNGIDAALTAETARAQAAEAALAADLAAVEANVTTLQDQVAALQTSYNNDQDCDCAAIAAALAANATAIANLQASDSSTAVQIAAAQAAIEAMQVSVASVAASVAAAATAAAVADGKATAAAAAAAAVAADLAALTALEQQRHSDHNRRYNHHIHRDEVSAISCVDLGALFDAGISAGLAG